MGALGRDEDKLGDGGLGAGEGTRDGDETGEGNESGETDEEAGALCPAWPSPLFLTPFLRHPAQAVGDAWRARTALPANTHGLDGRSVARPAHPPPDSQTARSLPRRTR